MRPQWLNLQRFAMFVTFRPIHSSKRQNNVSSRDIQVNYMTVSVDIRPYGFDCHCSVSTAKFWTEEIKHYPHSYTYIGERCEWLMHSNLEMTPKLIHMCGEQADRICAEGAAKNAVRKLSNR